MIATYKGLASNHVETDGLKNGLAGVEEYGLHYEALCYEATVRGQWLHQD